MRGYSTCTTFLFAGFASANVLVSRDGNITLKAPIVATPSQHWEGDDGRWSTFEIRVGTPPQTFRVLPSTSWQETWVVYGAAAGICNASLGVAANCEDSRGGTWDMKGSSSWEAVSQNTLGLNEALGFEGVGVYGYDTVGLGFTNTTGPTLTHQVVAAIVSNDWWLGQLGLGFQPTNFSGFGNPQPSFSETLYTSGSIASQSWSYTAGAYYRLKSVFGSLIFGGFDASRFTPNDVTFIMAGDSFRDLVVFVQSISCETAAGKTNLLGGSSYQAFVDSSTPYFFLPLSVAQTFEKTFNLTFDNSTGEGLYLVSSTAHAELLKTNPNITFTLSNEAQGGKVVDIVLPYAAFDMNLTAPALINKTEVYFPIRAINDDQSYTLGRTFLQEAYVTAHYNSRTFNISQTLFSDNATPEIRVLPADLSTYTPGARGGNSTLPLPHNTKKSKLSPGAIAGIVIGALVLLALLAAAIFFLIRRKKQPKRPSTPVAEIDSGKRIGETHTSAYQDQASAYRGEMEGKDAKVEIQGNPIMHPQELEAEVPRSALLAPRVQAPFAEIGDLDERGLGHEPVVGRRGGDVSAEVSADESSHEISPNTERSGSIDGGKGVRHRNRDTVDTMVSAMSPVDRTVPGDEREPRCPSPTESTRLERRKSRFSERFIDD